MTDRYFMAGDKISPITGSSGPVICIQTPVRSSILKVSSECCPQAIVSKFSVARPLAAGLEWN